MAELTGAAMAMRDHVVPVENFGLPVVDTCGTGGTGISTFNISTCAALVAAGAGAKIAKHGNRTSTRASGSANVLAALGVNIECDAAIESRCLKEAGVCFSFAVKHHPAMKFAVPVRKQLGVRTIFNVLGPLTNPAGALRQVMGVPTDGLTEMIAGVLGALGGKRALVVHSGDGLDEISTTAPARISELFADGHIETRMIDAAPALRFGAGEIVGSIHRFCRGLGGGHSRCACRQERSGAGYRAGERLGRAGRGGFGEGSGRGAPAGGGEHR